MCRDEVDEDGVQQLLCDSVSLHDDGTHQVHHVHLHLLVMAVTVETEKETDILKCYLMKGGRKKQLLIKQIQGSKSL